jgi:imidazolonepropionase-like amidohydrolase
MSFTNAFRLFKRLLLACGISLTALHAQQQTTITEGMRDNTPRVHAFINARIVKGPGRVVDNGTLVIRDGVIVGAGAVQVPKDARVWDLKGLTLYPGLIDAYSSYGMPVSSRPPFVPGASVGPTVDRGAGNWNGTVQSQRSAAEIFSPDPRSAEKLRSQGLTSVLSVPIGGIFKGTSALVSLGNGKSNDLIIRGAVAQHLSLDRDTLHQGYPESLMGAIALIRQTLLDADWYQKAHAAFAKNPALERPEMNASLEALKDCLSGKAPVIIDAPDVMNVFRAEKIAQEFSLHPILRGSGREYQRTDAVAGTHLPLILPVNFPEPPLVQTPEEALRPSLEELRYWDEAPVNPARLAKAGVEYSFTTADLKDPGTFLTRIRKAVRQGLSPDAALASLTEVPARLFKAEKQVGSLDPGHNADFIITDGDLFAEKTAVKEVWIGGKRYEVAPRPDTDPRGTWEVAISGASAADTLFIKGEIDALKGTFKRGKSVNLAFIQYSGAGLALSFPGDSIHWAGTIRMSALAGASLLDGRGEWPDGTPFTWTGRRTALYTPEADTSRVKASPSGTFPPVYPPTAFGRGKVPPQVPVIFIKGGTIWTSGPQGILENADILFRNGKVAKVGHNLEVPALATVIDGKGKHVTPGIIDCHSHMTVSGDVNEGTLASSAMVRIGDVIDPDDIDIYRNLAGGTTEVHALHGSANPIGGQCQLVKLRWGMLPEEIKFEGAPRTIKFALGENVKESNWGENFVTRYPQSRMGVEQFFRDRFRAALDYEKKMTLYEEETTGLPVRRDLEMDALVDIIHGRLLIHCHAYRQDEILMLMRVAEEFGFRIRAFQHILEGYKVADAMAKHGAGGSTFSDWWAFKLEVYDAIPYNGPLMHDEGVLVSFNSDSDELSRRLNLEAAKAVKYGGLSESEAFKFVTINPARQLGVDARVGSLEVGKDADFAIWNGSPLSTYSLCEQTWIEGRRFFDREEDRQIYREAQKERAVLIQKILSDGKGSATSAGGTTQRLDTEVQP